MIDEVGRSVSDTKVPEPIGCDGERHGFCADLQRENLACHDPCDGTPCRGKESNICRYDRAENKKRIQLRRERKGKQRTDADKSDEDVLASLIIDRNSDADDCDKVLASEHAQRAPE